MSVSAGDDGERRSPHRHIFKPTHSSRGGALLRLSLQSVGRDEVCRHREGNGNNLSLIRQRRVRLGSEESRHQRAFLFSAGHANWLEMSRWGRKLSWTATMSDESRTAVPRLPDGRLRLLAICLEIGWRYRSTGSEFSRRGNPDDNAQARWAESLLVHQPKRCSALLLRCLSFNRSKSLIVGHAHTSQQDRLLEFLFFDGMMRQKNESFASLR